MQLSFVIPVYNCKNYLEGCINSVIPQINSDYEIILIDDGSTDNSASICDKYARIYNNIEVVHTRNRGASRARNLGIKKSKGDYIIFVDSDDELVGGFCDSFSKCIKDMPDILYFGYIENSSGIKKRINVNCEEGHIDCKEKNELFWKLMDNSSFSAIGTKIYRRKFLLDNNITFIENQNYLEDFNFAYDAFRNANSIYILNKCMYIYNINTVGSLNKRNFVGAEKVLDGYANKILADIKSNKIVVEYQKFYRYYLNLCINIVHKAEVGNLSDIKEVYNICKNLKGNVIYNEAIARVKKNNLDDADAKMLTLIGKSPFLATVNIYCLGIGKLMQR